MQIQSHAPSADHDHSHAHHHHHHGAGALQAVRLAMLFVGSILVLAAFLGDWIYPDNRLAADFSATIGAILLALPIFWVAIQDLLEGHMHMDELVALAVLAAMALGDFRTAGVVAFFMVISQVIETRTAQGAHQAIERLVRLSPSSARRVEEDGSETDVPAAALKPGDRIRVFPGESVPTDGEITTGKTTLNEASITGESVPRTKGEGDEVYAGTINLTGMIELSVTRVGEDTTLGRVRELILAAEQTKLPITKIIDRYAGFYTPVVLMLAALVWFITDDWVRVVALLVISCPCAFILATPTAMVAALSAAARHGILVKNVVDLEGASRINAMIFDKTGTLTTGELGVVRLAPQPGTSPADLVRIAATAERYSNHPAAQALVRLAEETEVPLGEASEYHEEPGQGVSAVVDGVTVRCGRVGWLTAAGIAEEALGKDHQETSDGLSGIYVARGDQYLGWIGLSDQVRPEAAQAIEALKALPIKRIAMITGDRTEVAAGVAAAMGGCEYRAECLPQEKAEYVESFRKAGYTVAFVGDGVNDAPALSASDTGIAMGAAGSDVAIHSATVALMSNDLMRVPLLMRLSHSARRAVYQNLSIGAIFILGGLVLAGIGELTPIVATLMHNAGSLIVVFNSARLVRFGEETADAEPDAAEPLHRQPAPTLG